MTWFVPSTHLNTSSGRRLPRAMLPKFSKDKIHIWAMIQIACLLSVGEAATSTEDSYVRTAI
jgi:hypothetical protein